MKIIDGQPIVSAEKAIRVGMYYALRAYPGGTDSSDPKLRATMKDILDGRRIDWGSGNSWITDTFAAVYNQFKLPVETYELLKARIFNVAMSDQEDKRIGKKT